MSYGFPKAAFLAVCVAVGLWATDGVARSGPTVALLAEELAKVRRRHWNSLQAIPDPNAQAVIDWHRLRDGPAGFHEYLVFMRDFGDWPGLPLMRRSGEETIPAGAGADEVLAFFDGADAQTPVGALRLAAALRARGAHGDARAQIERAWMSMSMTPGEQEAFEARHRGVISPLHAERLDALLWMGKHSEARRLFPKVDAGRRALAEARMGLRGDWPGVDHLIDAVPKHLRDDPGLAYERFRWRLKRDRYREAARLLITQTAAGALGDPERWASHRGGLARGLMRSGDHLLAYGVASNHGLHGGSHFIDLEFLSGYLALRFLGAPARALTHFRDFEAIAKTPISRGRANYWVGRAHEALGNRTTARLAYAEGAKWQTSFYGQLAAEKVGASTDPALLGKRRYPVSRSAPHFDSSVWKAAGLLLEAGETDLAERWIIHLCESLDAHEMGEIADMMLDRGEDHIALRMAKFAANQGIVLQRAYYPVADIGSVELGGLSALTLSIARRESEFDKKVISPAGARGLMQLMPGTAREMAARVGRSYSSSRLLTDKGYNALLGTAYLDKLDRRFDGYQPLMAAAYNAGPTRVERWRRTNGDPRARGVDPIDWIEHIPFNETRNYVMRVMESVPIYEMRLAGEVRPLTPSLDLGRR